MEKRYIRQIQVTVVSGVILMLVGGLGSAFWVANSIVSRLDRQDAKLEVISGLRQRDALRIQGNLHDLACAFDALRDTVWRHTNPKAGDPIYSSLAERIPDIPRAERERVNSHIGNVQLEKRP